MSTILPPNSTAIEVASDAAIAARLDAVGNPVRSVWDPDTCPAPLLPWLAYALRVDGWRDSWSEVQKRNAIAVSIPVHRRKGTVGAMKRALDALGYSISISEGSDGPYTFRITLEATDVALTVEDYTAIASEAERVKNVRSHLGGVDQALTRRGVIGSGGAVFAGHNITISPADTQKAQISGSIVLSGAIAFAIEVK